MAANEKSASRTLREERRGSVPLTGGAGETFKWDKIGKEIEGRFLGLKDGSMGGQLVKIDDGKTIQVASAPEMLRQALEDVKIGTRIVIRYTGEAANKKGQSYKTFEAVALPD